MIRIACFSRASFGAVRRARAFRPELRGVVVASKELKVALRLIDKVLTDPRVEQGQRDQLRTARRELVHLATGGKLKRRDVFRCVEMIASVLLEIAAQEVARRPG
jgi:hypothetical protein